MARARTDPGTWDTSSAGHVDEGEEYVEAAKREVREELGISNVPLLEIGKRRTERAHGIDINKRYAMLYSTIYDGEINFEPTEISEVRWISPKDLKAWMEKSPDDFSYPFLKSFEKFLESTI